MICVPVTAQSVVCVKSQKHEHFMSPSSACIGPAPPCMFYAYAYELNISNMISLSPLLTVKRPGVVLNSNVSKLNINHELLGRSVLFRDRESHTTLIADLHSSGVSRPAPSGQDWSMHHPPVEIQPNGSLFFQTLWSLRARSLLDRHWSYH